MTLIDIENLPAAELKKRRDELVAEAAKADTKELASRYVQARCDAAMRDDKLREQGVTINTLNDALATAKQCYIDSQNALGAATGSLAELEKKHAADCATHREQCAKLQADAKAAIDSLSDQLNETQSKLAAETARANRNAQLAARSEAAINAIAKTANDIIAARQVETNNEGA